MSELETMAGGRPLRLLWLIDNLGVGGAESLVVPFVRGIDRAKIEPRIASIGTLGGSAVEQELRRAGVVPIELGARHLRDRAAFRRLLDYIRSERIELIHAHLTYSAIWGALVSRKSGVPSIASLHVAPWATREQKKTLRHRIAVDARDWLMRFVLSRWSRAVVTVSEGLRQTYVGRGGLSPSRVLVAHNGIDVARFRRGHDETRAQLERELDLPAAAPLLVTVSVLRPGKGLEVLLDAMRSIPASLLVVGDGPLREELVIRAKRGGIADRVRWGGYRSDVDAILAGCDLFVHPSLDDAFPTVLLEAMAAGLPVVASNVGGIPEIVVPDVTGVLVPAGDAAALASAVNSLLADQAARQEMAAAAERFASERFSTEAWISRLEAIYGAVLASRHERRIRARA